LQPTIDEPLLLSSFIKSYPEFFAEVQPQMLDGYAEKLDGKYHLKSHA